MSRETSFSSAVLMSEGSTVSRLLGHSRFLVGPLSGRHVIGVSGLRQDVTSPQDDKLGKNFDVRNVTK